MPFFNNSRKASVSAFMISRNNKITKSLLRVWLVIYIFFVKLFVNRRACLNNKIVTYRLKWVYIRICVLICNVRIIIFLQMLNLFHKTLLILNHWLLVLYSCGYLIMCSSSTRLSAFLLRYWCFLTHCSTWSHALYLRCEWL